MEKLLGVAILSLALLGCGPDGSGSGSGADGDVGDLSHLATGQLRTFDFHDSPIEASTEAFLDGSGREVRVADFAGKVLLINVWATWCAPCIREMPQLDSLAHDLSGEDFALIAVSTDRLVEGRMDRSEVETFLREEIGATFIPLYTDWPINFALTSQVTVWPTTILYDRQGREIGRINGPAEWDSEDAHDLIEGVIEATRRATGE